ncbi:MAG: nif-specific transcriptional activator NifA [Spirochaetales bacterium]|jgi:Nif-specific regulatory protein|nr:nif-specific transcriptional activator NifA [Spirochaetales bacterium]
MEHVSQIENSKLTELSLLFEISQILDQSMDIKQIIEPVLAAVAEKLGMLRGTISVLNRSTGEIFIEAAYGLSASQMERGKYQLGEGITGKVIQSGQPMIVPKVSKEPLFLNRTGARKNLRKKDISFICVPIKNGNEVIGALSADKLFEERVSFTEDVRLLSIIASLLAQAIRLRQGVNEEKQRLIEENSRLQEELKDRFRPSNIIGNAKSMQAVYDLIAQVSRSDATVLVRGESGTGKELVAHAIHYNSPRAAKPFIKVNCAALPETVIESELFGHERGAFTGALSMRKGRFELANGGTIFLDEIGDLSATTQVKILRALQEKEFERVGGNQTIRTNVRVIAATNRNLEELMEQELFREDLYYRLNVFPIHIPPLRERKSDIMLLADFFIEKYSRQNHLSIRRISTPAIDLLMAYHWPGNVRELENCIERAILLSTDEVIHSHHLPPSLQSAESTGTRLRTTLPEAMEDLERELLMDALKSTKGNMAKAAKLLGITERVMGLRVARHAIKARGFRSASPGGGG